MSNWTKEPMEIYASAGGYSVKTTKSGVIADFIQRYAHPVYDMHIDDSTAKANAEIFLLANEMAEAILDWTECQSAHAEVKLDNIAMKIKAIGNKNEQ